MSTSETDTGLRPRIQVVKNTPMATSLAVAEHFGKEHWNVMRDVRKLIADLADLADVEVSQTNFMELIQLDHYGREQKYFRMTELGFSLLVMGFTGQRAIQWKLAYAQAFMAMRAELEDPVRILQAEIERLRQLNPEGAEKVPHPRANFFSVNHHRLFVPLHDRSGISAVEQVIKQVEQQRQDLLYLKTIKTRYVLDPRRLGAAEAVLRLTYALSKNEAPVLWFLLNESLHSTWISMSIHDIAANLRQSVGSDSTVKVALQRLVARNLLSVRKGSAAGAPHSYYVNTAGVADVLNQFEQKWLSFPDAGPNVPGLTDSTGHRPPEAQRFDMVLPRRAHPAVVRALGKANEAARYIVEASEILMEDAKNWHPDPHTGAHAVELEDGTTLEDWVAPPGKSH